MKRIYTSIVYGIRKTERIDSKTSRKISKFRWTFADFYGIVLCLERQAVQ